jgi:hypothetical protein
VVECQLPKLDVAGSIPVSRSNSFIESALHKKQVPPRITRIYKFKMVLERFPSCCIHSTVAVSDHLIPATRHPEASHANCKVLRRGFRDAEGSAPLHRRAIHGRLDDRLP